MLFIYTPKFDVLSRPSKIERKFQNSKLESEVGGRDKKTSRIENPARLARVRIVEDFDLDGMS